MCAPSRRSWRSRAWLSSRQSLFAVTARLRCECAFALACVTSGSAAWTCTRRGAASWRSGYRRWWERLDRALRRCGKIGRGNSWNCKRHGRSVLNRLWRDAWAH